MRSAYDLVIVGCGPAGLAAAVQATKYDIDTVLFDEQNAPGGQIYRAVESSPALSSDVFGDDYTAGKNLVGQFRRCNIEYCPNTSVWQISEDKEIGVSSGGRAVLIKAKQVILATGAMERPLPVKGWTLPGVMTAGAAQILLKTSTLVAQDVVLIGCGPLLYLLAWQYLQAGVGIKALLDTTSSGSYWRGVRGFLGALSGREYIAKGVRYLRALRHHGVPHLRGVNTVEMIGQDCVQGIRYCINNRWHELDCRIVFVHQGIIPNVNLSMAGGIKHYWNDQQLSWQPRVDYLGQTNIDGIMIAGDGAGIVGAKGSECSGHLAALNAAKGLNKLTTAEFQAAVRPFRAKLVKEERFRRFIDVMYRPADSLRIPQDDVLVCRCEEVTAGQLREATGLGCMGPNQLKAFTRCGMGPCQGRLCGTTVSELMADERNLDVGEIGHYRIRPPVKPVTLGELALLVEQQNDLVYNDTKTT